MSMVGIVNRKDVLVSSLHGCLRNREADAQRDGCSISYKKGGRERVENLGSLRGGLYNLRSIKFPILVGLPEVDAVS